MELSRALTDSNQVDKIAQFTLPSREMIVMMNGIILGYPVIYCLDPDSQGNCLGGQDLVLVQYATKVIADKCRDIMVASYTIPAEFEHLAREHGVFCGIDDFAGNQLLERVKVTRQLVNYSQLVL